jgi:ABC-type branched-subunit amino acid transport system substrate-binding protein
MFNSYAEKLGIEIICSETFRPGETDLSAVISRAKRSGARIYVLLMAPQDAYQLVSTGRAANLFTPGIQLVAGESLSDLAAWEVDGLGDSVSTLFTGMIAVKWIPSLYPSPQLYPLLLSDGELNHLH